MDRSLGIKIPDARIVPGNYPESGFIRGLINLFHIIRILHNGLVHIL